MENALWNEKHVIATEIAKEYSIEKKIRKASGHKELCCPDPECQHTILRYCHGEKKDAFFAHLNNEHCDYAIFDRENTQIMRTVRRLIYESFKAKGYTIRTEVKILDHHYTHLFFDMDDGSKLAVEMGTQRLSANRVDTLTDEYRRKGVVVNWIVLGNTEDTVRESQTYFLKRYLLNESTNKDLIVVNCDGSEIAQYKVDPNKYKYNGHILSSDNYPETYTEYATLTELTICDGELTLTGFNGRYNVWLQRKRKAFQKRVIQLEEESKQRMKEIQTQTQEKKRLYQEQQAWVRSKLKQSTYVNQTTISTHPSEIKQLLPNKTYEKCKEEILPLIEQQQTLARDSMGKRWVKCEKCGRIDTDGKFVSYGGQNHVNLGLCNNCCGSRMPQK